MSSEENHEVKDKQVKRMKKDRVPRFDLYMKNIVMEMAEQLPADEDGNKPNISIGENAKVLMSGILKTFLDVLSELSRNYAKCKNGDPKKVTEKDVILAIRAIFRPRESVEEILLASNLVTDEQKQQYEEQQQEIENFCLAACRAGEEAVKKFKKSKDQ